MHVSRGTRFPVPPFSLLTALLLSATLFSAGCRRPGVPPRVDTPTFQEYYSAGLDAWRLHDDQTARECFLQAAELKPDDAPTQYYLAILYAENGKEADAIAAFERSITLDPSFPQAYYNLGTLRLNRQEAAAAAPLLEHAIALDPEFTPAYVNLGKAYFLNGLPDLAEASFQEALRRDPENQAALENLAYLAHATGDAKTELHYREQLEALK
jgi:tetratricopeptide (TPR) repeat protein